MKTMQKVLTLIAILALTGCFLRPHKVDVQQGNVWPEAAVAQLHLNMKKTEVQGILGEPLLANAFASNYWTYVYTNQINGGKVVKKSLTLYFFNDRLVRIDTK